MIQDNDTTYSLINTIGHIVQRYRLRRPRLRRGWIQGHLRRLGDVLHQEKGEARPRRRPVEHHRLVPRPSELRGIY